MPGHIYSIYVETKHDDPSVDGFDFIDAMAKDIEDELKGHGYDVSIYHDGTY